MAPERTKDRTLPDIQSHGLESAEYGSMMVTRCNISKLKEVPCMDPRGGVRPPVPARGRITDWLVGAEIQLFQPAG